MLPKTGHVANLEEPDLFNPTAPVDNWLFLVTVDAQGIGRRAMYRWRGRRAFAAANGIRKRGWNRTPGNLFNGRQRVRNRPC